MKALRNFLSGLALLTAALLALGVAAPYLVDGRTIRDQLVAKLSAWAEGDLRVSGDVRLTSLFDLTIEASDVEIRSPERFPEVSRLRADIVEASLSRWELLNGRIVFRKVWVTRPVIAFHQSPAPSEAGRTWRALLLNEPAVLDTLVDAARQAPFEFLRMDDVRITAETGPVTLLDGLSDVSLTVRREVDPAMMRADMSASMNGGELRFELARGAFTPKGPTLEAPVRVEAVSPATGRVLIDGRIVKANGARFTGRTTITNAPIRSLANWLDVPAGDAFDAVRYDASGALEVKPGSVSLQQLEMESGATRMSGLLTLALEAGKPQLSGTLSLNQLDLRGLSLVGPGDGVFRARDPMRVRRGGARAICTWLEQFDADVRLSSERILLDGTETREAAAFLSVNEARATLDLAELMVFDGLVNGQFNARWHEDAFRLSGKGNASGVELGALLARLGGHSLASGPADVSFTMQGAGNSLDGLWRNARVSGRLMALQGGELALDVAALAAQARAQHQQEDAPQDGMQMTPGRGDYDMLRAVFSIGRDALGFERLEIVQDGWMIRGEGEADLAKLTMDWRFNAGRVDVVQAGVSGLPPALEDMIQLHLRGPLHYPRVSYQAPALPLIDTRGKRAGWPNRP